jgi:hypothetical protein
MQVSDKASGRGLPPAAHLLAYVEQDIRCALCKKQAGFLVSLYTLK